MTQQSRRSGGSAPRNEEQGFDAVVVGAGFAGMYMLHRLRGLGLAAIVLETAPDVGGTWFWNRYPGARCDVESMQYSYSFSEELQQEWHWSELYASQPEILAYARHVADRLDLRRDIRFERQVASAHFDEHDATWLIVSDRGERYRSRFCIMATGCLSAARQPDIEGMETFRGPIHHTGRWPHHEVDFAGQRVGLIGTGSSGIQATPVIAAQAASLHVFQRTANFSIPARNRPMSETYEREWKSAYSTRRATARTMGAGILYDLGDKAAIEEDPQQREQEYERRWAQGGTGFLASYTDLFINADSNESASAFVRERIRETVKDQTVAEALTPRDHPIGTKRICVDTDYFEAFNRDNVTLVDIRGNPIERITPDGIVAGSTAYAFDSLVLATGFDALTGALRKIDIVGRGGLALKDKWQDGPRTYLGLMTAGFPNMFIITGPGSPSVFSNVIVSIEDNVDWIARCLDHLGRTGASLIEAAPEAEDGWMRQVAAEADARLFGRANSWYLGANIPGKPRVFMPYVGGLPLYQQICDEVAEDGYRGFEIHRSQAGAPAAAGRISSTGR